MQEKEQFESEPTISSVREQFTYYYSNFQLFSHQEQVDMLVSYELFKNSLSQKLGEKWRIQARQLCQQHLERTPFQLFLSCWLETKQPFFRESTQKGPVYSRSFQSAVKSKLVQCGIEIEQSQVNPLSLAFLLSANEIWSNLLQPKKDQSFFKSILNRISERVREGDPPFLLKPLIMSKQIIPFIRQNKKEQEIISQLNQFKPFKQQADRQLFDTKKVVFQPFGMFDPFLMLKNAYKLVGKLLKNTREKWQIARGFVYSMSELNKQQIHRHFQQRIQENVKIRILQPAAQFYNGLLVVWLLFKQKNMDLKYYMQQVKLVFGQRWQDKLIQPVKQFYQIVIKEWKKDQSTHSFIQRVRTAMETRWETHMKLHD